MKIVAIITGVTNTGTITTTAIGMVIEDIGNTIMASTYLSPAEPT
jgi:hypothetical protein